MKLGMRTKLSYALAGVGDSSLYNITGVFLLFFLTTVAGVSPAAAGTIAGLGAVWESFCAPLVGYISDKTETRYGRRKPFLLGAAVPLAVVTGLLFTAIDAPYGVKLAYYGMMTLLFWTSFAAFFVPYLAWGAELTQDYNERTVLRSYTYVFNTAGTVLGSVLPTIIVDYLMNMGRSEAGSWQMVAVLVGGCSMVSILVGAMGVKNDDQTIPEKKKRKKVSIRFIKEMLIEYWQVLNLRSIRFVIGGSVFFLLGYSILTADRMYFLTFNMKLSAGKITFVMMLITVVGVMFSPLLAAISNKLDKRGAFILCVLLCTAFMWVYRITGISGMFHVCLYSSVVALGNTAYWQLMPAMLYDVCEVDQLAYGKKRSGVLVSLQSLAESVAQGIGLQVLGLVLEFTRFDGESVSQNPLALEWVNNSFTVLPAVFMMISVAMMLLYPVSRTAFEQVLEALQARERGETVDLDKFKKLI